MAKKDAQRADPASKTNRATRRFTFQGKPPHNIKRSRCSVDALSSHR
jgi:hypothetical protein